MSAGRLGRRCARAGAFGLALCLSTASCGAGTDLAQPSGVGNERAVLLEAVSAMPTPSRGFAESTLVALASARAADEFLSVTSAVLYSTEGVGTDEHLRSCSEVLAGFEDGLVTSAFIEFASLPDVETARLFLDAHQVRHEAVFKCATGDWQAFEDERATSQRIDEMIGLRLERLREIQR